jgi:hypothetical protein
VSGSAGQSPRWWWFVLGFWRTIPIVTALVIGYAIGHQTLGALMGLAFLLSGFGFSRWIEASSSRHDDDRLGRALALYFAAMGAVLLLVVILWLIVEPA